MNVVDSSDFLLKLSSSSLLPCFTLYLNADPREVFGRLRC